jgi:hypothetical protein
MITLHNLEFAYAHILDVFFWLYENFFGEQLILAFENIYPHLL